MVKLHFIHINDFHSHFQNFPAVQRIIDQKKKEYRDRGEYYLIFDDGDNMDRCHPLTEATMGAVNVDYLNQLNVDTVTIGNNEGLGLAPKNLKNIYEKANFEVIEGNVFEYKTAKLPTFAKEDRIFSYSDIKIGVFGYTAFFETYFNNDWFAVPYENLIKDEVIQLRSKVDVLIFLSHLGINVDRAVADEYPKIDVIVGSHTHHLLPYGELRNGVLITAAGKYYENVGFIDVEISEHQIVKKTARTIPVKVESGDQIKTCNLIKKGDQLLSEQVVMQNSPGFESSNFDKSKFSDLLVSAIQNYTRVDCVILNAGLFLQGLPQGLVSYCDVFHALPHPLHPLMVNLSGEELIYFILELENQKGILRNSPITGASFRGKIFGSILYYGITIESNSEIYFRDKLIDDASNYQLIVPDNFRYLNFFPTIRKAKSFKPFYQKFLREILRDYLLNEF